MAFASQPPREEIQAAYQSARNGGQVAAVAPVAPAPQPAAPAAGLAGLLKRADAQEAEATLMLDTTYDPLVIGHLEMRSITPYPAMARQWYQKAATLGSADARRRLSQLQHQRNAQTRAKEFRAHKLSCGMMGE